MKTSQTSYSVLSTIVGDYLLISEDDRIAGIYPCAGKYCPKPSENWRRSEAGFRAAREQLAAYFAGDLKEFELRLSPRGTPFQLRVWNLLSSIPYGTTTTYGELARKLGNSGASRAVGAANGRNPISVVVPCHRVIGGNGKLTGYAGGLDLKRKLLALEGQRITSECLIGDSHESGNA